MPIENRPISTLYKQSKSNAICQKEKNELLANLNYKIAMPIIYLLLIISIFPYLMIFSKNISIFYISSFAILGFVVFHTIMDSFLILGENSTLPPYMIIWSPIIIISIIFGKKYLRA